MAVSSKSGRLARGSDFPTRLLTGSSTRGLSGGESGHQSTPAELGSCCLVLHTHLPWVAHTGAWPVGEEWLDAGFTSISLLRWRQSTNVARQTEPMSEDQRQELVSAADTLEALAARTTGGQWCIGGLLATRPGIIAHFPDGSTEHIADARTNTADWITTVSPLLAAPLAAWLRSAADNPLISPDALAVSRTLASGAR